MSIPNFKIVCSDDLMKELEAHCFSETKVEVGGFLVGHIDGATARVTAVVRAKHSVGKSTQLTFTHDTWNALHSEMNELDGTLIGWYHSHPNFGVFLSEHDQFIQQNFFKQEGNITIVIDPVRGRRGWFYSSNGKIVKYQSESDTTRERLGKSATNSDENIEAVMGTSTGGVSLGKVIVISTITSILGAFLGVGLSGMNSTSSASQSDISRLNQQVAEIQQILIDKGLTAYVIPEQSPTPKATSASPRATTTKKSTKPQGTKTETTTVVTDASLLGKACNPKTDKKRKTIICIANVNNQAKGTWKLLAGTNTSTETDTPKNG